jgi:hypothetical protein
MSFETLKTPKCFIDRAHSQITPDKLFFLLRFFDKYLVDKNGESLFTEDDLQLTKDDDEVFYRCYVYFFNHIMPNMKDIILKNELIYT